jgi:prepilin peptidase CpaA
MSLVEAGLAVMLIAIVIVCVGLPAILIDARVHRIPNLLVLATLGAGFLIHVLTGGVAGLKSATVGAVVGLALLLPFYLLRAMGAGDVKFMGALGALVGSGTVVLACAIALVAGGLLAVALLGWRSLGAFENGPDLPAGEGAVSTVAMRMPYAAALVAGALSATLLNGRLA